MMLSRIVVVTAALATGLFVTQMPAQAEEGGSLPAAPHRG
jgi:hypothetical protein